MNTIFFGEPSSPFGSVLFLLLIVIVVATWVLLAASRFVHGGAVERPERVAQLYGYTVCLIAVVMALTSVLRIVEAGFDRAAPQFAGTGEWGWQEPSVTSFEAYRATYERAQQFRSSPDAPKPDTVPEAELRRRYEALRADRIERVRFNARRSLVTNSLTLVLAVGLFAWHWRWVRRRVPLEFSGAAARLADRGVTP
ncbi:MAG TPA: hypothetical protein VJ650_18250 [Gemmatimonadaceae bacterium]|nr:hypothetical protein [Gemmatimonadaceae bacterium]